MSSATSAGAGGLMRWLSLFARVAGTAIVFVIIARQVDLSRTVEILASLPAWFWPAALAASLAQIFLIAFRWQRIAGALGGRMRWSHCLQGVFVSLAINQCLPSFVGGDAYRVLVARRAGMELAAAIHSVILDRVSALVALVVVVLVSSPLLLARIPDGAVRYGFFSVLAAGLALLVVVAIGPAILGPLARWQVLRRPVELLGEARRVLVAGTDSLPVLGLALCANVAGSSIVWLGSVALGAGLGLADCLIVVPWVMLTLAIPISIAGWGLREGAMVGALSLWGIDKEPALVLSILLGLVGVLWGFAGLAWWLARGEGRLSDLREAE